MASWKKTSSSGQDDGIERTDSSRSALGDKERDAGQRSPSPPPTPEALERDQAWKALEFLKNNCLLNGKRVPFVVEKKPRKGAPTNNSIYPTQVGVEHDIPGVKLPLRKVLVGEGWR